MVDLEVLRSKESYVRVADQSYISGIVDLRVTVTPGAGVRHMRRR